VHRVGYKQESVTRRTVNKI